MEALKKALLDGLRLAAMAVIAVVLMGIDIQTGAITVNWQLSFALGLVAFLKTLDKWLHESGIAEKGLTRF